MRAIMSSSILFSIALCTIVTNPSFAQGNVPQVTITNIVADSAVQGTTAGLPAQMQGKACVILYVHTDLWYIHPYANAGLGQSFTMVDPQGNWQLETVQRHFPANRVAVIVMSDANACQNAPERTADVRRIQNPVALRIYDLKGDGSQWFGRL